ncbi:metal-dependent phosphohydrolase [Vibrio maritimus]|uniref:Metal-dependent phosphohydrolase n=1 Tax=Vibrio maritimus TaxID=990268 RepID=A0A090U0G9_9VIBR|nr:metal-dependent phosphohydrolase [Vibrio maritimus]
MLNVEDYEQELVKYISEEMTQDPAHDINHVYRVVKTAKQLCQAEGAMLEVVLPAAYLHDCFSFPKNHPDRAKSSTVAADKALAFLNELGYPSKYHPAIHHCIVAHSFSANIAPQTLEAQIVQDADRLDALGAIGIVRCLQVGSHLGISFYDADDPFCSNREPDDKSYSVDHFYTKLFRLPAMMQTDSANKRLKTD